LVHGLRFIQRQTCHKDRSPAIRHPPTCPVATHASGRTIKIHNTLILSVLYGLCNPHCHVTEKQGMKVSENRIVSNMFGPKREEVTKDCMMRLTMCSSASRLLFG
jgi:hypothetical protein